MIVIEFIIFMIIVLFLMLSTAIIYKRRGCYKPRGTLILGEQNGDSGYGLILDEKIDQNLKFVVLRVEKGRFVQTD